MWPFKREPELKAGAIARLIELEERQAKLEKKLSQVELEWSEWFDKFRLMYARLTKRIRDAQGEPEPETSREDAPGRTIGAAPDTYHHPRGTAELARRFRS